MSLLTHSATLLLFVLPRVAHACLCTVVGPASEPLPTPRPWSDRARIFVGHAIEVDPPRVTTRPRLVRFVTEASWSGPVPDTISLVVGDDAPCAMFFAGSRYRVAADADSLAPSRLRAAECESGAMIPSPIARSRLAELGAPAWRAPPHGRRALDAAAVRLGAPLRRDRDSTRIAFLPAGQDSTVVFEIGDYRGSNARARGRIIYLEPGLYQLRMTWPGGSRYETYLSARCEVPSTSGQCLLHRSFLGLESAP